MLFSDNIWWDVTLLSALGVSWLALSMAFFCIKRLRRQAELTQKLFHNLEASLQANNSSAIGMGKKLLRLEKRLQQRGSTTVADTQPVPAATTVSKAAPAHSGGLTDATLLLNAGLEVDEVARRCGISRAEASLMKMIHNHSASAA